MSIAGALIDSLRAAVEPSPYNPDDTTDLIGLALIYGFPSLIAAIAGTATAVITVRGQRKGKDKRQEDRAVLDEVSKKVTDVTTDVKAVRRQVNNDHPEEENLRDQMDYMQRQNDLLTDLIKGQNTVLEEIKSRQDDHGRDIRGIRTDVGQLRGSDRVIKEEHDDLVRRLNGFIRREHPGADPL